MDDHSRKTRYNPPVKPGAMKYVFFGLLAFNLFILSNGPVPLYIICSVIFFLLFMKTCSVNWQFFKMIRGLAIAMAIVYGIIGLGEWARVHNAYGINLLTDHAIYGLIGAGISIYVAVACGRRLKKYLADSYGGDLDA